MDVLKAFGFSTVSLFNRGSRRGSPTKDREERCLVQVHMLREGEMRGGEMRGSGAWSNKLRRSVFGIQSATCLKFE